MKIIRKHEQKTNLWSGGKTTELFIYPDGSSYAERNFQFRISTATIETATSEFTRLNGFKRHLMILDGTLKIHHKNHYQKTLNQFDVDEFMGDWETTAEGKVTDFNLMHDANFKGKIEILHLEKQLQHTLKLENDFTAFYVLNESVNIENQDFQKGNFVITNYKKSLPIYSKEKANLIIISINSVEL